MWSHPPELAVCVRSKIERGFNTSLGIDVIAADARADFDDCDRPQ